MSLEFDFAQKKTVGENYPGYPGLYSTGLLEYDPYFGLSWDLIYLGLIF